MKPQREVSSWSGRRACPRCFVGIQFLALALTIVVTSSSLTPSTVRAQQAVGRQIVFPVSLQWNKQKGVTRYRLQIASDERFQDVFFDGRVVGNRYVVNSLAPGYYYWRAAAAEFQLGTFSRPQKFFLPGGLVTTVRLPNRKSASR